MTARKIIWGTLTLGGMIFGIWYHRIHTDKEVADLRNEMMRRDTAKAAEPVVDKTKISYEDLAKAIADLKNIHSDGLTKKDAAKPAPSSSDTAPAVDTPKRQTGYRVSSSVVSSVVGTTPIAPIAPVAPATSGEPSKPGDIFDSKTFHVQSKLVDGEIPWTVVNIVLTGNHVVLSPRSAFKLIYPVECKTGDPEDLKRLDGPYLYAMVYCNDKYGRMESKPHWQGTVPHGTDSNLPKDADGDPTFGDNVSMVKYRSLLPDDKFDVSVVRYYVLRK